MSTSKNDDFDIAWPLGPRLVAARLATGASRKELARRAEVSDTFFQNLERGYELRQGHRMRLNPGAGKLVRVARAVGMDAREALQMAGLPTDILDQEAVDPHEDEAFKALRSLWVTIRRKHGPEAADRAIDRLWRDRHTGSIKEPDQPNGSSEGGTR